MFDRDKWQEIFETIQKNKWRTLATAFGVFWGILMLVLLLGAGQGLQNGVVSNMILDSTNSIWFFTDRTSLPYKGLPPGRILEFTEEDLGYIKKNVPGIEYISPENGAFGNYTITYGKKASSFQVLGTGEDYFNIKIYQQYVAGRKLNLNDNIESRKVCVIGDRVAEVLFGPGEDPIGKEVFIKETAFKVVGVFHDEGWGGRFSERVYMPFRTFQRLYNPRRSVQLFAVTTREGTSGRELERKVLDVLKQRHTVHPDDNQAFWTHNQEDNYRMVMGLFFGIKTFVWMVGIFTLIAGIVGVSNIMMIVVKDRTREIGIRKALGATPFSIVSMIVQESVLITGVAGYLGLVAGIGMLFGLNRILSIANADIEYFDNPSVNLQVVAAAVLVLVVSGALAGFFPALRAARIHPVEALRGDV